MLGTTVITIGDCGVMRMNKSLNLNWHYIALWIIARSSAALAHEISVHEAITANAAESAFTYSPAYRDFLSAVSLD